MKTLITHSLLLVALGFVAAGSFAKPVEVAGEDESADIKDAGDIADIKLPAPRPIWPETPAYNSDDLIRKHSLELLKEIQAEVPRGLASPRRDDRPFVWSEKRDADGKVTLERVYTDEPKKESAPGSSQK